MTKILNIIKSSIKNIVSNKLRSLLTILGLVIGASSVIILVGIGDGSSNKISSSVKSLGTNVLTLSIKSDDTSLDYSNIEDIKNISNIELVAPYKTINSTISRGTTISSKANIIATTPDYLNTLDYIYYCLFSFYIHLLQFLHIQHFSFYLLALMNLHLYLINP